MNNSITTYADEITALKRKYKLLMGMFCGLMILWTVTVIGHLSTQAQASEKEKAKNLNTSQTQQPLLVSELVVVDKNGTPRVRIAGDLPQPMLLGKRFNREGDVAGVMLYDAEGNERGGYVTGERSISLTMDEINRQAVSLTVGDKSEMSLSFSNGRGGFLGMGLLPEGSWLRLDTPGKPPVILPNIAEGEKK